MRGRVTSPDKPEGISGISFTVQGTSKGTTTDDNGQFQLSGVSRNASLVFTSVGFTTQTIAIRGRSTLNVAMEAAEVSQLEQVVVIGYGSAKKKDLTGAVASVKPNVWKMNIRLPCKTF